MPQISNRRYLTIQCYSSLCLSCTGSGVYDCTQCNNTVSYQETGTNKCKQCLSGQYGSNSLQQCENCASVCITCTGVRPQDCLTCRANREGANCNCPAGSIDYLVTKNAVPCGTCEYLLVNSIRFSSNFKQIIIDLGFTTDILNLKSSIDPEKPSFELCQHIFPDSLIQKFGTQKSGVSCMIKVTSHDKITIDLDISAQINAGENFIINQDTLRKSGCSQNIKEFILKQLELPLTPDPLIITLSGPHDGLCICEDTQLIVNYTENDGGRGFTGINWQLLIQQPVSSIVGDKINKVMQTANQIKSQTLRFGNNFFNENSKYQFQLTATNKFGITGTATYQFTTGLTEGIIINKIDDYSGANSSGEIQSSQITYEKKIPIWSDTVIQFNFFHVVCVSSYNLEFKSNQNLTISWQQLSGPVDLKVTRIVKAQEGQITESSLIPAFTMGPGEQYLIRVNVTFRNSLISASSYADFNFITIQSPLIVNIIGGSRIADVNKNLQLQATVIYPDSPLKISNQGVVEDVTLTWSCKNQQSGADCVDKTGAIFTFNNTLKQEFPSSFFSAYKTYVFSIEAQLDNDATISGESSIELIFSDIGMPSFEVQVPQQLLSSVINPDDQINVKLNYSQYSVDPDQLFCSLVIIYNQAQVAATTFNYVDFRFKIWNYFNSFSNSDDITLKILVQNPAYMMPSQSSLTFKINIPPQYCQFIVTPILGQSISDDFSLIVKSCVDQQLPLKYKFIFFNNINDSDAALIDPSLRGGSLAIRHIVLQDFSLTNSLTTRLPQGYSLNGYNVTLMAIISDSDGSKINMTQTITVGQNNNHATQQQDGYTTGLSNMVTAAAGMTITNRLKQLEIIYREIYNAQYPSPTDANLVGIKQQLLSESQQLVLSENSPQNVKDGAMLLVRDTAQDLFRNNSQPQLSQIQNLINFTSIIVKQQSSKIVHNNSIAIYSKTKQQLQEADIVESILTSSMNLTDLLIKKLHSSPEGNSIIKDALYQDINYIISNITTAYIANSLPNEPAKVFSGQTLKVFSQIITKKNFATYIGTETTDWKAAFQQSSTVKSSTSSSSSSSSSSQSQDPLLQANKLYIVQFKEYLVNPFANQKQFPYPNSPFSIIDPDLKEQGSDHKIQISSPIIHSYLVPINSRRNLKTKRLLSDQLSQDNNYTYVCISQDLQKNWKSTQCETLIQENESISGSIQSLTVHCICQELTITTIVNDKNYLFLKNPNQPIKQEQKSGLITQMRLYKYALFYIGCFFIFSWFCLIFYGYIKDKLYIENVKGQNVGQNTAQVVPITQQEQTKQQLTINDNQLKDQLPQQSQQKANLTQLANQPTQLQEKQQVQQTQDESPTKQNQLVDAQKNQLNQQETENKNQVAGNNNDGKISPIKKKKTIVRMSTLGLKLQQKSSQLQSQNSSQLNDQNESNNKMDTQNDISPMRLLQIRRQSQNQNNQQNFVIESPRKEDILSSRRDDTSLLNKDGKNIKDELAFSSRKDIISDPSSRQELQQDSEISSAMRQQKLMERRSSRIKIQHQDSSNQQQQQQQPIQLTPEEQELKTIQQYTPCQIIMITHELLSIFSQFDETLPRSIRFTICYVKTTFLMIITAFFSQSITEIVIQIVLTSCIGLGFDILTIFMKIILRGRDIIRAIGLIMLFVITFIAWYFTLAIGAEQGPDIANIWTLSFIIAYIIDQLLYQIIIGSMKFNYIIKLKRRQLTQQQFKMNKFALHLIDNYLIRQFNIK